ncbi:hypothetical protein [Corynebacterium cystitidis]|uniref:Uncharacterized protein n=1 Tax=Corynebacterium cystitidis DSM 20524 TaxID=1121357 RepID=A0A1H9WQQ1_9CORY|nr:hypothetical protein [Corynebacterium cystitidis]WJY81656.1 hypothetical protein CCYS_03455 [Corynebacterium cystitidis DSM 20524]SES35987.1 hypothetical protein SAMN05661109_02848 [Corynebacterium cystitidis DSM 20524]SNV85257.1 Uncharacterised protein [Corynebacterium cystitidis]
MHCEFPALSHHPLLDAIVEEYAWGARAQLKIIAREHDLDNVRPIAHPGGATFAAVLGYALYAVVFVLALNLALVVIAGGQGFDNLLTVERG